MSNKTTTTTAFLDEQLGESSTCVRPLPISTPALVSDQDYPSLVPGVLSPLPSPFPVTPIPTLKLPSNKNVGPFDRVLVWTVKQLQSIRTGKATIAHSIRPIDHGLLIQPTRRDNRNSKTTWIGLFKILKRPEEDHLLDCAGAEKAEGVDENDDVFECMIEHLARSRSDKSNRFAAELRKRVGMVEKKDKGKQREDDTSNITNPTTLPTNTRRRKRGIKFDLSGGSGVPVFPSY